jgi:4-coumarate--CoA ligase
VVAKLKVGNLRCGSQGYGMTELPLISFSVVAKERLQWGSVGVLVPGIEVRVTDVETGRALPPLANGELWIRGPMVMTGRCP